MIKFIVSVIGRIFLQEKKITAFKPSFIPKDLSFVLQPAELVP
jgi:hypothetical protein